jgi:hypothetical protein
MVSRETLPEDIADWWQSIISLVGGDVMNMRRAGKVGWLIIKVTSVWSRVVAAGKAVAQRCRLDDSLVGKLLVRRSNDGKAWRRLVPSRHARCPGRKPGQGLFISV